MNKRSTRYKIFFLSFMAVILIVPFAAAEYPLSGEAATATEWKAPLRIDFSVGGAFAPSYASDVALLSAAGFRVGGGLEYVATNWIPFRTEFDVYSIGNSAFDSSLYRFRAFWGLRFAILSGLRFPIGEGELNILAGGAASLSRYTGLSAATAYLSIIGEARYFAPFFLSFLKNKDTRLFIGVPVEYMFRGTARTIDAGLELGLSVGRKAAK